MKLYYFYTLKALWNGQGKIKMYYGMSKVKKQLSGKRSINGIDHIYLFYCSNLAVIGCFLISKPHEYYI